MWFIKWGPIGTVLTNFIVSSKKWYLNSFSAKSNSGHLQHDWHSWQAGHAKKNYSFLQNQLNYSTDTNYYQSIGGLDIEVFESQLKKWTDTADKRLDLVFSSQIIIQTKTKIFQAVLLTYNNHYLSSIVHFLIILFKYIFLDEPFQLCQL